MNNRRLTVLLKTLIHGRTKRYSPATMLALDLIVHDIANELKMYKEMAKIPPQYARNFR